MSPVSDYLPYAPEPRDSQAVYEHRSAACADQQTGPGGHTAHGLHEKTPPSSSQLQHTLIFLRTRSKAQSKAKHKDHKRRHEHGPSTALYVSREHPTSQRTHFPTLLPHRHGEERARRREGTSAEPTRPADAVPGCEAGPTPRRAAPARGARPPCPRVCGRAGRHVLLQGLWLP